MLLAAHFELRPVDRSAALRAARYAGSSPVSRSSGARPPLRARTVPWTGSSVVPRPERGRCAIAESGAQTCPRSSTHRTNPETDRSRETEPIKQRKNGLYPGVSDELAESMKGGWADTELHDLEPIEQAPNAARRRAALSARFPGERLVIPAGNLKTRSNDTEYAFRASTEYVYLTGDQTEDGVLVLEPTERRPRGDGLPAAPLQPRERRVLARRPGRAVGRPPQQPGRGRAAARRPLQGRPRAGRGAEARPPVRSASCAATTPVSRPR